MPAFGAVAANQATKRRREEAARKRQEDLHIRSLIKKYDKTHTNGLNRAELAELLKDLNNGVAPTDDEVDWVLKQADREGNQLVSPHEMETALSMWANHQKNKAQVEVVFKKYDTNNSGRLERDQVRNLLTDLNDKNPPSEAELNWVMSQADISQDGTLRKPEIMHAVTAWYTHVEEKALNEPCCVVL
jgi:Ca2+-binding EF-hand superfamily protein|eukprot:CAMPEP_0174287546 /NCGR_PEP_ID=MMETSP0809-20121228/16349_1 /TAXON_ID=73025 ORGANISM="Eutreptiella gymnastica-like, Strain CCMP1594" /NCGR_SAMPLE_ID=MMETSP0809 /ASSEMBLY_ACC=CAM_ASM_000658 /LENGTH=187 /DNA_ID=CAMNT_0015384151 /DNA_START=68 /DNA_END=631 /DNA_ORIENTATION=+